MKSMYFILLMVVTTLHGKEEESNEINPAPPINLDSNLRRALLKALTELENEENEKTRQNTNTNDRLIEKAPASALSFYASTDSSIYSTTTQRTATHKPIVIVQRSKGVQHKPITTVEKDEHIITSASNSFTTTNRIFGKTESPRVNSLSTDFKINKPVLVETTTPVSTTTTTTEESQAKVEDVQFFSAPLVAAFTVHQDERGIPKSVVPIYKTAGATKLKSVNTQTERPFKPTKTEEELKALQLQQNQKALEDEILKLRRQQDQHNILLRQQQLLHEQQLQQQLQHHQLLQKQKLLEEQARSRQNLLEEQARSRQNQHTFNPVLNEPHRFNTLDSSRVKVSFQPSISFVPNQNQFGLVNQALPSKNPGDFRAPFNSNFNFINTQQQLPLNRNPNFNSAQNIQTIQLTTPGPNRVFRQESDTGNFFNNNFNSGFNFFNQQQQQPNRFFRSNGEVTFTTPASGFRAQPPVVNHHLNNLLYNSGIVTRGKQEDLNIVSKVLALNHFGRNPNDFRFASSNLNEQRALPPSQVSN